MYAFPGDMRSDVADESREVHCLRASLSEQDLDDVEGLSARAFILSMQRSMVNLYYTTYRASVSQHQAGRMILDLVIEGLYHHERSGRATASRPLVLRSRAPCLRRRRGLRSST